VSESADKPVRPDLAAKLRALHESRARAELTAADALAPGSDRVMWRGALLAEVAVVKGLPGPAEATGGAALSGADGDAITKALEALGWGPERVFFTLSRPEPGMDPTRAADRLRLQLEAIDPLAIVALDAEAAADLVQAFGCEPLVPGVASRVLGRSLVALSGFEAALAEPKAKQRVWGELKAAKPEGPVY
jgi:CheY-like chemotaxis protein